MDGDNASFDTTTQFSNGHDISENTTILEEGLRVCPLCQSEIKLFFINLNEKLMMCENTECEYPFGYEDLQFVKEDINADSMDELCSISSKRTTNNTGSTTCSIVSATAWSEIDRMNRVFESDDSQLEYVPKLNKKLAGINQDKNKALKKVACIKGLTYELKEIDHGKRKIANKKYIKKLMTLQEMTGVEMLQPEEANIIGNNKEEEVADVKIDVNTNENCVSSIKIEFVDITSQEKAAEENNDVNAS